MQCSDTFGFSSHPGEVIWMTLGVRLRRARTLRGWTLDQLAGRTGISKSLLSRIERDRVEPSLRTLKTLAAALEISLAWLFHEDHSDQVVVRKDQRRTLTMPRSEIHREIIAPDIMGQLTLLIAYLEPGQSSFHTPDAHAGEECVLVLRGEVKAQIGEQVTILHEGDTLSFDARFPHLFWNEGSVHAEILAALVYPPLTSAGEFVTGSYKSTNRGAVSPTHLWADRGDDGKPLVALDEEKASLP